MVPDDVFGQFGEEQAPSGKIPIRDRRKLREFDDDPAGEEPGAPEAAAETAEPAEKAPDYLEDLQRLQAEFDNYRRRTAREQGQLREFVAGEIIGRLLGVLDNFQLAVTAAEGTRDFDSMLKGVEMVYRDLRNALEEIGLEPIDAVGMAFDPNMHEAVAESEGDGSGVMAVEEILRCGYMFKGAVLRPAMVKVTHDAGAVQESGAPGS